MGGAARGGGTVTDKGALPSMVSSYLIAFISWSLLRKYCVEVLEVILLRLSLPNTSATFGYMPLEEALG